MFRGGELREYEIKPVLLIFALGFLATTKALHKKKENSTFQKFDNCLLNFKVSFGLFLVSYSPNEALIYHNNGNAARNFQNNYLYDLC